MDTAVTTNDAMVLALGLLGVLALTNVLAFAIFGWDKRQARIGGWRVRERDLLLMAFLGGALGAKLGQYGFRHKTRKQPFGRFLNGIVVVQVLAFAVMFAPAGWVDGALGEIDLPSFAAFTASDKAPERAMPRRFGPGGDAR